MIYLITYDLRRPTRNYETLYQGIQSTGRAFKLLESVWILSTNLSAIDVRNHLSRFVDNNDQLVIIEQHTTWATYNVDPAVSQRLKVALEQRLV